MDKKSYAIAWGHTMVDLEEKVAEYMEQGYKCQGGVNYAGECDEYLQAMVFEKVHSVGPA